MSSNLSVRTDGDSPTRDAFPPGFTIGYCPEAKSPYSAGRARTPEEKASIVVQLLPWIGSLLTSQVSEHMGGLVKLGDETETKTSATVSCFLLRAWKGFTLEQVWDIFNRWDCPACGQKNFNSHYVCQNDACKQPRPA